jgi:hypothetical protein
MKWLDIPAHRVLEVEHQELTGEFDLYDQSGNQSAVGTPYLLFRRKDGKRFKLARFGDIAGSIKDTVLTSRKHKFLCRERFGPLQSYRLDCR